MHQAIKTRKKLIEVALPLDAINAASAREKSIRHGHPSTLHLWWARRPLAAARAVIFSQMVDDPSEYVDTLLDVPETRKAATRELKRRNALWDLLPDDADREVQPTLEVCAADIERQRLFGIIEDLVKWENATNEYVLDRARAEIWQSWRRACADNAGHPRAAELFDRSKLPAFHDPFAGGGALPLEAQRLGLEAHASDLNPVAVLINKAMIEIPPKFAGQPPVNPDADPHKHWKGAEGLAEDVRYYGKWMRDEADKRIGHLYPKVAVTAEMAADRPDLKLYVGRQLTVIAWLWARTVKSPNPAFRDVEVPLASTFMLSTKPGKEAWVEPVIENGGYRFEVRVGKPDDPDGPKAGTKLGRGANFRCAMSGVAIPSDHIYSEAMAGRMDARLMAIVAEGDRRRVYLPPTPEHEAIALTAAPDWKPDVAMPENPRWFSPPLYGLTKFGDLFTDRQLTALDAFSDLVLEARVQAKADATLVHTPDPKSLAEGGTGAQAYADAVAVYLAFAVDKGANYWSSVCAWSLSTEKMISTFGRQAIPMVWDYCEANPLSDSSGNFMLGVEQAAKMSDVLGMGLGGFSTQQDASTQITSEGKVVSTDPPYYDNIGYADLSDYFYVWLRRNLRSFMPDLFATVAVPKREELVATPYRHGGKLGAEAFFLKGMTSAMHRLAEQAHFAFPTTIYYAFKQAEKKDDGGRVSTGWITFLDAVIEAGFGISGTWPVRTEYTGNLKNNIAALDSSIVLVCRPRLIDLPTATRRDLLSALRAEMPLALAHLQRGNIAPVDLAQAAIGPGMAVYTRYSRVLDADGRPIKVGQAYAMINEVLDEVLAAQEGDFDADTRWALTWFDENGFAEADYGRAEQLSKAKNTSVAAMADEKHGGIIVSKGGKVRLRRPAELPADWDPATDQRLTVWEMVHHLIRLLDSGGEAAAGELAAKLGVRAETARELAYRLYTAAERRKRAADALPYNALVQSWPEITRLAREAAAAGVATPAQSELAF
jgi:putative DNA methylase